VMSRNSAVKWLYRRHISEFDFGWYDRNPEVRGSCREEWPVNLVSKLLRGEDCTADMAHLADVRRAEQDGAAICAELMMRQNAVHHAEMEQMRSKPEKTDG